MSAPQISVIMGTYNPGEKLKRAVDSIIGQSYEDWEMIIYNDGSDNYHSAYIERICSADKRIKLIDGAVNRGLAHGLNECIKASRGRYIARMDDDDFSEPGRFEMQKAFLDSNKDYGWVGSLANLYDDGVWGITVRPEIPQKKDFLYSSPFVHPSVMFRKEILEAVNGYSEDKKALRCEDYELFMSLYAKGYKGYNIQQPLLNYEQKRNRMNRIWRYSFYEAAVRYNGFRSLRILNLRTSVYVLKPLMVRMAAYFPDLAQFVRTRGNKGDKRV